MSSCLADIEDLHKEAVSKMKSTYIDPATGFTVFTEYSHLKRGKCCGNRCRHCPYGWEKVKNNKGSYTRKLVDSGDKAGVEAILKKLAVDAASKRHLEAEGKKDEASTTDYYTPVGDDDDDDDHSDGEYTSEEEDFSQEPKQPKKLNVPYTRTGDGGTSQLFTGERRRKSDPIFEALGTVDELCTFVGVVHAELTTQENLGHHYRSLNDQLVDVMSRLFDLGSCIASPQYGDQSKETIKSRVISFDAKHVRDIEIWIDEMTEVMPELSSFILPTGGKVSAHLHVCRTVCRRAERLTTELVNTGEDSESSMRYGTADSGVIVQYLNRLSDFFFTAARYANYCENQDEVEYKRPNFNAKQRGVVTRSLQPSNK